ncbi:MAG TPA: hypothetical protein VFL57_17610 [Bryobacteraceae bacterium]|nr:hypothetical protein [Bryobacteraceae bacterium]
MCTPSRFAPLAGLLVLALAAPAQNRIDPHSTMNITLPDDSPVSLLAAGWGDSTATHRGGAMLLELHTSLTFRNTDRRRIRGITLLVVAQDVTPGGKASVSVPSLNVATGEAFPVRIDLRLLRPVASGTSPLAEVSLDGVLFDDLSFYGPNRLNCQRSMTVWELEARRDRRYYRELFERAGRDALQQEMLASMSRQAERAGTHARVAHAARATNQSAERHVQFAFLDVPDAPLDLDTGAARIAGNELRSPRLMLRNASRKAITGVEIGWLVKDARGREFVTGGVPIDLSLPARGSTRVVQEGVFRFSQPDGPGIVIDDLRAFLASVEFEDGSMWVPRRTAGTRLPTPSPEEQRLAELYRKRGLDALIQELNKF